MVYVIKITQCKYYCHILHLNQFFKILLKEQNTVNTYLTDVTLYVYNVETTSKQRLINVGWTLFNVICLLNSYVKSILPPNYTGNMPSFPEPLDSSPPEFVDHLGGTDNGTNGCYSNHNLSRCSLLYNRAYILHTENQYNTPLRLTLQLK